MAATLFRVVNQQTINRSILLDKIDRSQSNFTGYANVAKQKLYVPYANPLNTAVKGYLDLVPTDQILMQTSGKGVIAKLATKGYVSFVAFNSVLTATPIVTGSVDAMGVLTIDGTTFLSLAPDLTYVILTAPGGAKQTIPQASFATHINTQITIANGTVVIGVPGAGWKAQLFANSKNSNNFVM